MRTSVKSMLARRVLIGTILLSIVWWALQLNGVPEGLDVLAPPSCKAVAYEPTSGDVADKATWICELDHALTAQQKDDTALVIPVFRDQLVIWSNGQFAARAELNLSRMPGRWATSPAFARLPPEATTAGNNRLTLVVTAVAGRQPVLGQIYIGPSPLVFEHYENLRFIATVLPTMLLGVEVALALLFMAIWYGRRSEAAIGWLALFLLFDAARGAPLIPAIGDHASGVSYWSLLVPFSSAAYLMFTRSLVGVPTATSNWFTALAPSLLVVAAAVSPKWVATTVLMPVGVFVTSINLMISVRLLAGGWRRGFIEARLLFFCSAIMLIFVFHDVLLSLQLVDSKFAIARPGLVILLIPIAGMMINRFTNAMRELDRTAVIIYQKVETIEQELLLAYNQLREQHERGALEKERSRLMRDLHDGLGGEMVAILALTERNRIYKNEIAYHARAALTDMRLIVASLEDYGGDLSMALGIWKERADPLAAAAGILLHWDIKGISINMKVGPFETLKLLRIMQEALVNTIRHAGASSIRITSDTREGWCILTLEDDGSGLSDNWREGKGVPNMQNRARAIGGKLEFFTSSNGTLVQLSVPVVT